jgi:hypothetical protein
LYMDLISKRNSITDGMNYPNNDKQTLNQQSLICKVIYWLGRSFPKKLA